MMAFLGLCNYSRHHIPSYYDTPLPKLILEKGSKNLSASLNQTVESETAFIILKQAMAIATTLAIPIWMLMKRTAL